MIEQRQLLNQDEISVTIERLCQQLMEKHLNTLVGISAKTEKNTETSTRRLANFSSSLV